jgi:hypothetical protein
MQSVCRKMDRVVADAMLNTTPLPGGGISTLFGEADPP